MNFAEFGMALLETRDLDPIYVGLKPIHGAALFRWLAAYSCFYHAGVSCWLSEWVGEEFWEQMARAALNQDKTPGGERWPRARERRHFRGQLAINAVAALRRRYPVPEDFFRYLTHGPFPIPFANFARRVCEHYSFGNWFAFKGADLAERVLRVPVSFSQAEVFMYREPAEGAILVYEEQYGAWEDRSAAISKIVRDAGQTFRRFKAPPYYDRRVGLPEIETMLCKYHAHKRNRYPIGKDIAEIRGGLRSWLAYSSTARVFESALPSSVRGRSLW